MGCTQSKEPTFELPPQKPPQLRSPLPPRIHTPLDRTRHTDVKPSPKRFTGTEFRGPAMQPRDKRKPQLRSPMTPRQPAQPAHKQALRSLDELLMQIDQFDFGEDRNPSRQSFHQIPEEHVYEEEWLMQDSKRTSHRISSFYGEFIDFYDSQSNAPETADLSYYTTVQEDYEYSRLSMMPKPSPINSSETLFDDDKALHMDTREHTLVQENPVKMICAFCEEEIDSHPTKLLGRYWHKHHSECKDCRRPMGVDNFAEIDGFLYCEDHYTTIRGTPIVKKGKRGKHDDELDFIRQQNTVKKVRNLFTFQKKLKINMLTVVEDVTENRRFVVSWLPKEDFQLDLPPSAPISRQ